MWIQDPKAPIDQTLKKNWHFLLYKDTTGVSEKNLYWYKTMFVKALTILLATNNKSIYTLITLLQINIIWNHFIVKFMS